MEYCNEGTISDAARNGLPEAMIRRYTKQILVAIDFLHESGIVHRDIKGREFIAAYIDVNVIFFDYIYGSMIHLMFYL